MWEIIFSKRLIPDEIALFKKARAFNKFPLGTEMDIPENQDPRP